MPVLPAPRPKSPVILPDLLQMHPRDFTLCSLWVSMKFHKREALYFHINIFILGKIKKCQYISIQFPTALKNVKYSCEHLLIPPSEIYFPLYLVCRLQQLKVVQPFHQEKKVRMICENHMEVIIRNGNEGFLEKKKQLVSYLVSMIPLPCVCFLYYALQIQSVNLYLWTSLQVQYSKIS